MNKLKSCILLMLFTLFSAVFYSNAYADNAINLTIKTEIINASEAGVGNRTFSYEVLKVGEMYDTYATWPGRQPYIPKNPQSRTIQVRNGATTTISFPWMSGNERLFIFRSLSSTDEHLSFAGMQFDNNLTSYTYNDKGKATVATTPPNWARIINDNGSATVTLKFRYNPDIDALPEAPDPNPSYKKQIDYLGDGGNNPDTALRGENDYRIYLDVNTESQAAETNKDIIFVLDVSNSMNAAFSGASRLEQMKKTVMASLGPLTQNPHNRISIISFHTDVDVLITNSGNKASLENIVRNLKLPAMHGVQGGGTNYYDALAKAGAEIRKITDPSRESVIFFLSDGEPTGAKPAVTAFGYDKAADIALAYALHSAKSFPQVDRFFSVFIGGNKGAASTLQTVTQHINTRKEKFMVQSVDADQLNKTFSRFLSKVGNSLSNLEIKDTLSEYATYAGEAKLVRITNGQTYTMTQGSEYTLSYDAGSKTIKAKLKVNTMPSSRYVFSFNVNPSAKAVADYAATKSYPHTGDVETDYVGNTTSAGKPGFYSNNNAVLSYDFAGGKHAEKTYNKPVLQVNLGNTTPEDIPANQQIEVNKVLQGSKTLEADMFSFDLFSVTKDAGGQEVETLIETAKNDASGKVKFRMLGYNSPGEFIYRVKEVIPQPKMPGMTYDEHVLTVKVTTDWDGRRLVVKDFSYSTEDGGNTFTNEYKAKPVEVRLDAKKILVGSPVPLQANEFQFRMSSGEAGQYSGPLPNPSTVGNDDSGDIKFNPITIEAEGHYVYKINEVLPNPSNPNIMYATNTAIITVDVTDVNGELSAAVNYANSNEFTNTFRYSPESASIKLKKITKGMNLSSGMFTFVLLDDNGNEIDRTTNGGSADVGSAGDILFNKSFGEVGDFEYKVKELSNRDAVNVLDSEYPYITFDTTVYTIKVHVDKDPADLLRLKVDVEYLDDSGNPISDPTFINTYKIKGVRD